MAERPRTVVALGGLCALALASLLLAKPQAFVGTTGGAFGSLQPLDRDVGVARGWRVRGKGPITESLSKMSKDELHADIAESRQKLFEYRMDVFRKTKPKPARKHSAKYHIVYAKNLLKAKEIEEGEKEMEAKRAARVAEGLSEDEPPPAFSELVAAELNSTAAKENFYRYAFAQKARKWPKRAPKTANPYLPGSAAGSYDHPAELKRKLMLEAQRDSEDTASWSRAPYFIGASSVAVLLVAGRRASYRR
mmetsp:Transcript_34547/g.75400  ORF Transcript_34547/g.75400 Transcript_34547/m.75400 type:complete len:250 (+) Transcript_34547:31-780(+)|eukprot:CAMPEP_0170601866 /NCGR_PEP_ID=MMETSP0224-20130122/18088_1 /TAXON_ID=285029 /ORGANISM="Togula jolla, Strain CCCM 725" /LENGTH=249 /DNA_ID=CAMNT_0010926671 /DNA_START=31 /DNA_END=780 /DNA_ORIENTATION=+